MIYDRIKFVTPEGVNVDIEFPDRISVITGNSSTGKTFFADYVEGVIASKSRELMSEMSLKDNVVIFRDTDIRGILSVEELKGLKGKLIIIDEADNIMSDEIADYINTDFDNQYLIFSRCNTRISTSPTAIGEFIREDKKIYAEYDRW